MTDSVVIGIPTEPTYIEVAALDPAQVQIGVPQEPSYIEVTSTTDPANIQVGVPQEPAIVHIFDLYHTSNVVQHRYTHTQNSASDTWVITHNLNTYPQIEVVVSGVATLCKRTFVSLDNVILEFGQALSGIATLVG